jgi:plastocyanin
MEIVTMNMQVVGVALLVACSVACGSSSPSTPSTPMTPTPTPSGSTVAVSIVSGSSTLTTRAYSPNPVAVPVGGTVVWTNNDATTHTSTATGGAFNSGSIAPGGTFRASFPAAGSFPYSCAIHPGMVGTVTVQ